MANQADPERSAHFRIVGRLGQGAWASCRSHPRAIRSLLVQPLASPGQRAEHALDADGESEDALRDRVIDDAERGGEIDGAHHLDSMKRLASVATRSL